MATGRYPSNFRNFFHRIIYKYILSKFQRLLVIDFARDLFAAIVRSLKNRNSEAVEDALECTNFICSALLQALLKF